MGGTFVLMSPTVPQLSPGRLSVLYLINLSELEMARRLQKYLSRPETEIKITRLDGHKLN